MSGKSYLTPEGSNFTLHLLLLIQAFLHSCGYGMAAEQYDVRTQLGSAEVRTGFKFLLTFEICELGQCI